MLPEPNGALPNGPNEPSRPASGPVGGTGTTVAPRRAISSRVATSGSMLAYGTTRLPCASVPMPGVFVIVAGFQNIDDRPADPAATPAKDAPCPVALCSRKANAPACARAVVARMAASGSAPRLKSGPIACMATSGLGFGCACAGSACRRSCQAFRPATTL